MSVISLTVVSINGIRINPTTYGFDTDDIVEPISNDGIYSRLVSRYVKGIDQQARSNSKYIYEVQENLLQISVLSNELFLADVTYRRGFGPQYAVNYQLCFPANKISGSLTQEAVGCSFYFSEDGDPYTVYYQVSQTIAQIEAKTASGGGSGSVTSVGLSMPSAFTVSNSPILTSGTIAVTGSGLDSQYVRGDGTLGNFPTYNGGGASVSYYLNGGTNQGVFVGNTYYEMSPAAITGTASNFSINTNGYIAQFITDVGNPNSLVIPAGNWNFEMYFNSSSNGGAPNFYVELYKYDGTTFTLVASSSPAPEVISNGTQLDLYTAALAVPQTTLTLTDRLAVRVHVNNDGRTITLHTQDSHLCQIITTFSTGITALNGLTDSIQTFATGTSGTDFNINSSVNTHTFNLPTASSTNRGALSNTDWTTFNSKVGTTRTINTTSPLSGGGNLSADRTLSISQSTASTDGYLNSTDWNTFNNKVSTSRSISTSAPLSGGGDLSADRTLSISQATTSTNGYLSSTDWNTFNNKTDEIGVSVGWLANTTLAASTTYYAGALLNGSPTTTTNNSRRFRSPVTGNFISFSFATVTNLNSGGATSTITLYNFTQNTSVTMVTGLQWLQFNYYYTGFTLQANAGDQMELRIANGAFTSLPTNVQLSGTILIRKS